MTDQVDQGGVEITSTICDNMIVYESESIILRYSLFLWRAHSHTHTKGFNCCDSLLRGSAGLSLLFVFVHHEARTSISKEQEIQEIDITGHC